MSNISKKETDIKVDNAVQRLALKIGVPKKWIYDVINHESGWDPTIKTGQIKDKNGKVISDKTPNLTNRGLIQFSDQTAASLGYEGITTSEQLVRKFPTRLTQLEGPVTKYFTELWPKKDGVPLTREQFLLTVFQPAKRLQPLDTPLSPKARAANPNLRTLRDYVNAVEGSISGKRTAVKEGNVDLGIYKIPNINVDYIGTKYTPDETALDIPRDEIQGIYDGDFDQSSLQIGDLIFLVDPTQISFNTQNGYHYFPTIRTKGNPKITTEEFVKNFSINLIFPNEDSINFQLLHLYAMFRRTPFVNLRNRDICEFFKEICYGSDKTENDDYKYQWLTVGLESIQVQSVEGFPNTLQATITLLPMDHRLFNGGFQALKDFADVAYQQQIIYRDWTAIESEYRSKQKLGIEEGDFSERVIDFTPYNIEHSPDFRYSLPFRTYYQSLISDRTSIRDNNGQIIKTELNKQEKDFARCRSNTKTNLLNPYISSGNRDPITLEYSYIDMDKQAFRKSLSDLRLDKQLDLTDSLLKTYNLTKKPEDVIRSLFSVFANEKTFFQLEKFKIDKLKNTIPTILANHGITVDVKKTSFSESKFLGLHIVGVLQVLIGGLSAAAGLPQALGALESIRDITSGKATLDGVSETSVVAGAIYNQSGTNTVGTFRWGIKQIQDWLNDPNVSEETRTQRQKDFTAAMYEIQIEIQKELGLIKNNNTISIIPNKNASDGELFKITSIPLTTKTILIDNRKDVITSWSLMFANKFVSIPLQAWEYPLYQHIGCEDPALSVSITSTSEEPIDLKSNFSILSEKMHETIKFVNTNSPELSLYLDTRLRVNGSPGNIFDVFGIKNLIFESSNSTNIPGKPNAWTTNINFSQADLTIQDYHDINSIQSNYELLNILSKLLLHIVQKDNGIEVVKFINTTTQEVVDPSVPALVQIHFIQKYKDRLNKLVEDARSQSTNALTNAVFPDQNRTPINYPGSSFRYKTGNAIEDFFFPPTPGALIGINSNFGRNTTTPLPATETLVKELENFGFKIVPDHEANQTLNTILSDFPEMEGALKFLLTNFDNLLEQKFQSYTQLIQPNVGFIDRWWREFSKSVNSIARNDFTPILFTLVVATASVAGVSAILPFVGPIAGASLASSFTSALVGEGKEKFGRELSNFIIGLENLTLSSIVQNFANKLIKDPVIFKKFSQLLPIEEQEKFKKISVNKGVSCYKDFDLPNLIDYDPEIIVGPDFYLYNNVILDTDYKEYIAESLKRYTKIGKLSAMMCLEESKTNLESYDKILKQAEGIDPKILNGVDKVVRDGIAGTSKDDTSKIEDLLLQLNSTIERFGLIDETTTEDAINSPGLYLLNSYVKLHDPKTGESPLSKEEFEYGFKLIESYSTKIGNGIPIENMNYRKLNLVKAARTQTMVQIFEVYISLDKLIRGEINSTNSRTTTEVGSLTKFDIESSSLRKLYEFLTKFIPVCESVTTGSLQDLNLYEELTNIYSTGGFTKANETSVMLPAVYRIENLLYNNIGYYIRLNSAIVTYEEQNGNDGLGKINLSSIPELRYLDVWNFRAKEENQRKIEMIQEFNKNSKSLKKDTTIKLYPTFKIFFVQENKNFMEIPFDNYFSQDAINSIEVITNKNSASKTAIIKLSNVIGNLTDKASLLRESIDFNGQSITPPKQFFLGTLDIKPGTMILIKVGYGPYDKLLHTVFNGRIIEMNPGPMVEMVCQSYGAQLNHYIQSENFGFFSSVREYGDVASSVLDMIPGLEKLGKPAPFGVVSTSDFTGKNLRNRKGKFGESLLMSNIIGNLNSILTSQDNPRDENIFLEYSTIQDSLNHPTFDWVVSEQSVWEVLRELALYHRDTIVTVRPFNDDVMSTYSDLRETLVMGKKTGYYKFTDSYSLSALNKKEIDQVVYDFDQVKPYLPKLGESIAGPVAGAIVAPGSFNVVTNPGRITYKISDKGKILYTFLRKPINALVIVSYLIKKNVRVPAGVSPKQLLIDYAVNNRFNPNAFDQLVSNIFKFSRTNIPEINDILDSDSTVKYEFNNSFVYFSNIASYLKELNLNLSEFSIAKEEFYNVKVILDNTDSQFINDPQYKKIQTHHLITDATDIISNNISLNGTFNNMVNLYYTGEPKLSTSNIEKMDADFIDNKLNVWSIKAFGEQRDEFTRPLNSYQKNIDTNWFDTAGDTINFFTTFRKVNRKQLSGASKGFEKDIFDRLNLTGKKDKLPYWNMFPSFVTVGASLLRQEVEKMYQGTLELVGNPFINPLDILHIQDYTNDMHGVVEVEEVIHSFTPDRGFRTIITPNLITYDREPISLQDVQIIDQIYSYANWMSLISVGANLGAAGLSVGAAALFSPAVTPVGAIIGGTIAAGGFVYNGTVGTFKKHQKFLFEQMGNILGRDCINFTTLLYHGIPFMAGFDGVDYTSLKTLMNYNVAGIKNPITRYLAYKNTFATNMLTAMNPEDLSITQGIFGRLAGTKE